MFNSKSVYSRAATAGGLTLVALIAIVSWMPAETFEGVDDDGHGTLRARILATGIPGAGAVAEVGDFLIGSPLHDKAVFTVFTQPGQVLDPKRVLVASTSNFGAPLARSGDPEGSILSIDVSGGVVAV